MANCGSVCPKRLARQKTAGAQVARGERQTHWVTELKRHGNRGGHAFRGRLLYLFNNRPHFHDGQNLRAARTSLALPCCFSSSPSYTVAEAPTYAPPLAAPPPLFYNILPDTILIHLLIVILIHPLSHIRTYSSLLFVYLRFHPLARIHPYASWLLGYLCFEH